MRTICLITILSCLSIHARIILTREDTISIKIPIVNADSVKSLWGLKMNAEISPLISLPCNSNCVYSIKPYYNTAVTVNFDCDSTSTIRLRLKYGYFKGYEKYAFPMFDNITYGFSQELLVDTSLGRYPQKKSVLRFFGLTLINSGLGVIYSSHNTPAYKTPSKTMDYLCVIMDAALVPGLFVNDKAYRNFSYVFLPILKASVVLRYGFILRNNMLVKSKYKYVY